MKWHIVFTFFILALAGLVQSQTSKDQPTSLVGSSKRVYRTCSGINSAVSPQLHCPTTSDRELAFIRHVTGDASAGGHQGRPG